MKELTIEAKTDNLEQVLFFVNQYLEECGCSMKAQIQMDVAVEEIFVNIASYAYDTDQSGTEKTRTTNIKIEITDDPYSAVVTFVDEGIPYDPLAKEDPDISLPASERPIGGLGIYMVKKSMDDVQYAREEGRNVLTIRKNL